MKINDSYAPGHYQAASGRYEGMNFRRCGHSGLLLPAISLGLWHNFGHTDNLETGRHLLRTAFDQGVTHFDLANNYGPPYGAAEENFGRLFQQDWRPYRDELIISTKAGWDMWPGPYGTLGSRKYLIASLDQSLKRMGLEYVDIFYHHRPDPDTPLEETMAALDHLVRQGKALYVGISQYPATETSNAIAILKSMGTPLLIHQPKYNLLDRWVENGLLDVLEKNGVGSIAFSPLEQGILSGKYVNEVPADSRIAKDGRYLKKERLTPELREKIQGLDQIAKRRGQTLAQMAVAWILRDPRITSVLVGASNPNQLLENIRSLDNLNFMNAELEEIQALIEKEKN